MKRIVLSKIIILWVFTLLSNSLSAQDIACYIQKTVRVDYGGTPSVNESFDWSQHKPGTVLTYRYATTVCSKTLTITVANSGTDFDLGSCPIGKNKLDGMEDYQVHATFYSIPKFSVDPGPGFKCVPITDPQKFTFSVDMTSALYVTGKVSAISLQVADNESFLNARTISLTSGTATLSYSELAGSNKSAWYGKWLYFRPMYSMSTGDKLYGSTDYMTKFFLDLDFSPVKVIVDLPNCAYSSPTIKIPASNAGELAITIKRSDGIGYNYVTSSLGSTINGFYVITESSPCLNSPNPDFPFGMDYTLYVEQSYDGTKTPCPYTTTFRIKNIPEFKATHDGFGFNEDDNSGTKVQIRKRGENGLVNFSVEGSCSKVIAITATRADGQTYSSNATFSGTDNVDGVVYYKGNASIELPAGTYTIVFSNQYCNYTFPQSITLAEPAPIAFTPSATSTSCHASSLNNGTKEADGTIIASNITGGVGNFTVTCGASSFQGVAVNGSRTFLNLPSGDHAVTVTDREGNTYTKHFAVPQPTAVSFATSTASPSMFCLADGTVTVSGVSGGTGTIYGYSNDDSNYQPGTTIGGYSAGSNRVVYVKDEKLCVFSKVVDIPEASSRLIIDSKKVVITPPSCYNDENGRYRCTVDNVKGKLAVEELGPGINPDSVSISGNVITIKGLSAGESYTFTAVDSLNGKRCDLDQLFAIPSKPQIGLEPFVSHVKNKGTATGSVTLTASGGNGGAYTFSIYDENNQLKETKSSPFNSSSVTFDNLTGSPLNGGKLYHVNVTDNSSCTYYNDNASSYYPVRILEPQNPLRLTSSVTTPLACNGDDNAVVELSASGGWSQQYVYSKDGSSWGTSPTFSGYAAGSHALYVKDFNGGLDTVTFTVTQPPQLTASLDSTRNVLCNKGNTGWLRYNVSGGTFPYSFFPANGSTTSFRGEDTLLKATGLTAKTWSFQIQDKNGCLTSTFSHVVAEPDALTIPFTFRQHTTCELPNGVLMARAAGGTPPYKYHWKNMDGDFEQTVAGLSGTDTAKVYNLEPDTYTVEVTDKNGCSATSLTLTVDPYTNPTIVGGVQGKVRCYGGSDGTIRVTGQKGNSDLAEYTLFEIGSSYSDANTTGYFENLKAGTYNLYVVDTKGCRSNAPRRVEVTQPETTVYLTLGPIQPVRGKGSKTGGIQASVFGGNDRLKEVTITKSGSAWSRTTRQLEGFPFSLDTLYAGTYSLIATDSKGCTGTLGNIAVDEPQSPLRFKHILVKNALCKAQTGSIEVQAEGGWGGYTYNGPDMGNSFYPESTFSNLHAGEYTITVMDRLGATLSYSVKVAEPELKLQSWIDNRVLPTCASNGELRLAFSGGTAPYHVFNKTSNAAYPDPTGNELNITGLAAGGYRMVVTDGHGCTYNVDAELPSTQLLSVSFADPVYPSSGGAGDGQVQAIVTGGIGPLAYKWKQSFGPSYAEPSATLRGVPSGFYELTVSEQGGCTIDTTYYLPGVEDYPFTVESVGDETSFGAKNGRCRLTSPFTSWAELRLVTPLERIRLAPGEPHGQLSCDGNAITLKNLGGGTYSVLGLTSDGRRVYASIAILPYARFAIKDPVVDHVKKIGGSNGRIAISVEGGGGENRFAWRQIAGAPMGTPPILNGLTGSVLSGIPAGQYEVAVTDRFSNVISQTVDVFEPVQPLRVTISDSASVTCKTYGNGYATLSASGGWGDYQFRADNSAGYANGNLDELRNRYVNLTPRAHRFYLVDGLGVVDSILVPIKEPEYLRSSEGIIDSVNCYGGATGEVTFHVTGGTKPYKYAYADNPTLWNIDTIARNLSARVYDFIISDKNGCRTESAIPAVKMLEPKPLLFSKIDVTHTTCNTDNGLVAVNLQGGSRPYRYEWFDASNQNISSASSLAHLSRNGYYKLKVYDRHNCYQSFDTTIKSSSNPYITNIDTTPVLCFNGNTGTALIKTVKAGSPYAPYTFKWQNGDVGDISKGYKKGIHSVTVTDTNRCSTVSYFEVTQPDSLRVTIIDRKDAHCFGYSDAFLQAQGLGGVGGYAYSWSTGAATSRIDNLNKGEYRLSVRDGNGCETVQSFTVSEPEKLEVDLGEDIKMCPGNSRVIDGQAFAGHTWYNSTGVISHERYLTAREANDYILRVTGSDGCFAWDTINLSIGNDALKSDFLMASQAELGDTLSIYELSNMPIDSVSWYFPHDAFAEVKNKTELDYAYFLKTLKMGIYNVELSAYAGGCVSTSTKQIEIVADSGDGPDDGGLGYKDPLIKSFGVSPNPSDGHFYAEVKLREVAGINLVLFSVASGQKLDERSENQLSEYSVRYNLPNLNSGIYLLIVRAGNERKQVKIIVQ